ncbi:hypothetical protein V8E51_000365 [Hyaloscypha variabilis]
MFGQHRRRRIFPDFRFENYGLVRGVGPSRRRVYNVRAAWAEAEVFVMRQLRMGTHPDLLERDIEAELLMTERVGYRYECLSYAGRILRNLRNARQFDGLPTYGQFEQLRRLRPRRAGYEMMMYDRFRNIDVITRYGGDIEIAREIARARALDREAEEELRRMCEADLAQLEQQYRANEEILLAELQIARTRTEAAEIRLQWERQRRQLSGMPGAWYGLPPYHYVPAPPLAPLYPAAAPRPQAYYGAGMNAGIRGERYPGNQMPYGAQDGFRPLNRYQQQEDEYQRRNATAGSEYSSTVYSDDSYYHRR